MNLVEINANVNRLLNNIWAIIAFLKEYLTAPSGDVSITLQNNDGTETVSTFPNIAKQVAESSGIDKEAVAKIWAIGEVGIVLGSDNKFYYPNNDGNPADNNPVEKTDNTNWYGSFDTMGEATAYGDTLVESKILADTGMIDLIEDKTPQLGGELDCNGKTINKSSVRQIADATPLDGSTHNFDYNNGDMQKITCPSAGALTWSFDNFPNGKVAGFIIELVNGGDCTITHPAGIRFGNGGIEPRYTVAGIDQLLVVSDKNGVLTLYVVEQDIS